MYLIAELSQMSQQKIVSLVCFHLKRKMPDDEGERVILCAKKCSESMYQIQAVYRYLRAIDRTLVSNAAEFIGVSYW